MTGPNSTTVTEKDVGEILNLATKQPRVVKELSGLIDAYLRRPMLSSRSRILATR
jgi:hypothetical protein